MKKDLILVIKGIAMGTANVVPGVSGGTIALITGIFERLIHALKSFNLKALKLIFSGKLKEFAAHIDLRFLIAVFAGIAIAIISIAKLFEYLFENYPLYIWAFFFGLILASVYFVGKTIEKWNVAVIVCMIIGTAGASLLSFINPATENSSMIYLFICGVVAICSMILPGLSGSFILILMGNYELVMIRSVNELNLKVLLPVAIGAGIGLLGFSHFLSWVFKKFRDQTIAVLTGFILGSVIILWPWKTPVTQVFEGGKVKVVGYDRFLPESLNGETLIAIAMILLGIVSIWIIEKSAAKKS
ncbi:MAG: DUF368 domain-containing protein [Bacteroidetes bacterium]|nr:DUF368 domain-containing protein [Bacteroidota bacterium]